MPCELLSSSFWISSADQLVFGASGMVRMSSMDAGVRLASSAWRANTSTLW